MGRNCDPLHYRQLTEFCDDRHAVSYPRRLGRAEALIEPSGPCDASRDASRDAGMEEAVLAAANEPCGAPEPWTNAHGPASKTS
jgi:hypothetical protein